MQARKNIIHIFLVLAMLTAGFPVYHPTDVNRDERTDLADAILQVRELAGVAENPQSFKQNLKEAVATLNVLSGFAKAIKTPGNDTLASHHDYSPYLLSFFIYPDPSIKINKITQEIFSYETHTLLPPVPPPKV